MKLNPTMLCDFYKVGHIHQYPKDTTRVYSTWTCRGSRLKNVDSAVFFGLQGFIKEYFMEYFRENFFERDIEDILEENRRAIEGGLGIMNPDLSHITALHELGYLPLEICAVPEGTSVPMRVPSFTMVNTLDEFFWLTNGLETLISTETWSPITTATIAKEFRNILDCYAMKTVGNTDGVDFQLHDFSMRGMNGVDHAAKAGCGHLLSFKGTDNIPAMFYLEKYYHGNMDNCGIGGSIPATEHSVQCANMPDDKDETETIRRMITEVYPTGLMAMVLDTNDFWKNVTEVLPSLKETIMARDGKLVVRPDSGDPTDIICGTAKIEDYDAMKSGPYNFSEAQSWMVETLEESVRDSTEHGEHGDSDATGFFKYAGVTHELKVNFFWNRHDKQYYYLDDSTVVSCEPTELSAPQKGLIETLFDTFGGMINEYGYRVLDDHIGAIYGDSITLERAKEICQKLEEKGFASVNIVLGVGSYSYAYNTRDTFGQAFKSTYGVFGGEERFLSKDPKTDDGLKKSQRGMVAVFMGEDGKLTYIDGLNAADKKEVVGDLLIPVFRDGELLIDQTLEEIRERM